jgi:F-type H+-transporting ATPase subunit epsilon
MTLHVQVVSPERILWSGEAELVTARTIEGGDITFLDGHAPFVGALETCKVTIRPAEGTDTYYAVHGGFVEVSDNAVSLLTDVSEHADDIDIERAQEALATAKAQLVQAPDDSDAVAAIRRASLRLELAGVVPD